MWCCTVRKQQDTSAHDRHFHRAMGGKGVVTATSARSATELRSMTTLTGISLTATSGTLRNGPHIDRSAHRHIVRTTQRLGCSPGGLTRSLTDNEDKAVNLIASSLRNHFSAPVLVNTRGRLHTRSASMLLTGTHNSSTLRHDRMRGLLSLGISNLLVIRYRAGPHPSLKHS